MRIKAYLLEELILEAYKVATYLLNRTPSRRLRQKIPFKKIQSVIGITPLKPNIGHLRVYSCRAYPLKYNILRLNKLALRAYIGYLVGYNLTNIFQIYILSQKKVIRIKDIKFNKQLLYNNLQLDLVNIFQVRTD